MSSATEQKKTLADFVFENKEKETQMCIEMYKQRKECFEKHRIWIYEASKVKGKGSRLRKMFYSFLNYGANKIFNTDDDDYEYCNKFGRGNWSKNIISSFTKEQQDIIVKEIAKEYGAFDY